MHSGVWGPLVAVGGTAAGLSGTFGGVFFWEASIGEWRAVSNHMVLAVVRSGEKLPLQPMPAEKKQKLFLILVQPVLLSTYHPHLKVVGSTASYTYTTTLKHSSSHSTFVQWTSIKHMLSAMLDFGNSNMNNHLFQDHLLSAKHLLGLRGQAVPVSKTWEKSSGIRG